MLIDRLPSWKTSMRTLPFLAALLLSATALAGCGDSGTSADSSTTQELASGKGGISGLVIDDRYRPIPGAVVVLMPLGLQATADQIGQVAFNDLEPGPYELLVQAPNHEAAPRAADVAAGEYTEVELEARRIFSQDGRIVTTEFSVFIPCAVDYVANGNVIDCTLDQSGDSFRAGFVSDYTPYGDNVTYLVTEMLANKDDRYEVQVRCEAAADYMGVARINGRYARFTLQYGNQTPDAPVPPEYGATNDWTNDCADLNTILFSDSAGREEIQSVDPIGIICCGAGAHFGIKAKFVQSLFLGPPEVDLDSYAVLRPDA
ncbi:MAG: Carboxypeptidase regulatory-like domain [Thermoplasmata archaeon]|jgi:hypothetical protein|nr:Carboxypeptidase regulatory-like domain [Thermoplasmata archaeon]